MTPREKACARLIQRFGVGPGRAEDEGFSEVVIENILDAIQPVLDALAQEKAAIESERYVLERAVEMLDKQATMFQEQTITLKAERDDLRAKLTQAEARQLALDRQTMEWECGCGDVFDHREAFAAHCDLVHFGTGEP